MQDSAKYLIHADIVANGVVERSDVVGAVFGQTEGLLGDELDLRALQESSKVGRIDVAIESEGGRSYGEVTIASGLDKVETAILAAALETIDRVGPCRADFEVTRLEDVRAAKRREVVDRAKELLTEAFQGSMMSSQELVDEVRQSVRIEDITEYEGYPAGPNVGASDAVIVVEGRADVVTLLQYGIKNAIAVEGTNVPAEVAELTRDRTVTAFLDGDRGGDLILKELVQVGDVDFVAFAPEGRSVEDLPRRDVMAALRDKVPYETLAERSAVGGDEDDPAAHEVAATDGSSHPAPTPSTDPAPGRDRDADSGATAPAESPADTASPEDAGTAGAVTADSAPDTAPAQEHDDTDATPASSSPSSGPTPAVRPATEDPTDEDSTLETLQGHVRAVVDAAAAEVRLLDADADLIATGTAADAFELVRDADAVPATVVLDGELTQRLLDVCAQRGVEQVVATARGEFVKRPSGVRIRTAEQLLQRSAQ